MPPPRERCGPPASSGCAWRTGWRTRPRSVACRAGGGCRLAQNRGLTSPPKERCSKPMTGHRSRLVGQAFSPLALRAAWPSSKRPAVIGCSDTLPDQGSSSAHRQRSTGPAGGPAGQLVHPNCDVAPPRAGRLWWTLVLDRTQSHRPKPQPARRGEHARIHGPQRRWPKAMSSIDRAQRVLEAAQPEQFVDQRARSRGARQLGDVGPAAGAGLLGRGARNGRCRRTGRGMGPMRGKRPAQNTASRSSTPVADEPGERGARPGPASRRGGIAVRERQRRCRCSSNIASSASTGRGPAASARAAPAGESSR